MYRFFGCHQGLFNNVCITLFQEHLPDALSIRVCASRRGKSTRSVASAVEHSDSNLCAERQFLWELRAAFLVLES